jgi:hypothetical protein
MLLCSRCSAFFPFALAFRGAVAQLGERLNGIQEVVGSIPIGSTNFRNKTDIWQFMKVMQNVSVRKLSVFCPCSVTDWPAKVSLWPCLGSQDGSVASRSLSRKSRSSTMR